MFIPFKMSQYYWKTNAFDMWDLKAQFGSPVTSQADSQAWLTLARRRRVDANIWQDEKHVEGDQSLKDLREELKRWKSCFSPFQFIFGVEERFLSLCFCHESIT